MFKLVLQDREGVELTFGDIVAVSNGKGFTFYSEVKYLEEEKAIAPFHTFSFHSFKKVNKLPDNARQTQLEQRYRVWTVPQGKEDADNKKAEKYLMDWRKCENFLEARAYVIEPLQADFPDVWEFLSRRGYDPNTAEALNKEVNLSLSQLNQLLYDFALKYGNIINKVATANSK